MAEWDGVNPITACGKCGGPVWDNRAKKNNPRSPDFACKNKDECGEAYWKKREGGQSGGGGGRGGNRPPAPPKWTWKELQTYYVNSLAIARAAMGKALPDATTADIAAATATVFIAATRDGIKPEIGE